MTYIYNIYNDIIIITLYISHQILTSDHGSVGASFLKPMGHLSFPPVSRFFQFIHVELDQLLPRDIVTTLLKGNSPNYCCYGVSDRLLQPQLLLTSSKSAFVSHKAQFVAHSVEA